MSIFFTRHFSFAEVLVILKPHKLKKRDYNGFDMNILFTNQLSLAEKWAILKVLFELGEQIYLSEYKTIHNNWEEGLVHSDKAIKIGEDLKDKLKIHGLWSNKFKLDMVLVYTNKSNALYNLARLEEALAAASIAKRIVEDVRNSFISKEANMFDKKEIAIRLATAYSIYGTILVADHQIHDGERVYEEAIRTVEDARILFKKTTNADDIELISILIALLTAKIPVSWYNLPNAFKDLDYANKLLQLLQTKKMPNNLGIMINYIILATFLMQKAALLHLENHPNTQDAYNEAITIWESLENTSKISDWGMMSFYRLPYSAWLSYTAQLHIYRGRFLLGKDKLGKAEKDFQSSIFKLKTLSSLMPTNSSPKYKNLTPGNREFLAESYNGLFEICYLENRLSEAIKYNNISINIIETVTGNTKHSADLQCFKIYDGAALLLKHRANPHDFAHEKSRRMAELLELTLWGEEEWDYRRKLRELFAEFHARWLDYCIDNGDTHIIPEILSIIQGRELAAEVLDKLNENNKDIPETAQQFHKLRLKLRKINARIQGIINGGRTSNNASGSDSRTAMLSNAPQLTELPPRYHKLVKVQEARLKQLRDKRKSVVQEPGYEVLNPIVTTTALQANLCVNEAMLLAIDRPHGTPVVLIIRNSGKPRWLEVPQLAAITDGVRRVSDGNSHSRGYLAGSVTATTDAVHIEGIDTTNFWDDIKTQLKKYMWQPLAEDLVEIKYLTIITHGNLHMSPIEAGAPKYLVTTRMPGLVLLAQRCGLIGKPIKRSPAAVDLSIDVHPGGPKMKQIPYVEAEQSVLQQLYSCKQVIAPGQFPKKLEQPAWVVHIASHAIEDEKQPGAAALLLAHGTITQHDILKDKPSLQYVYINACIAARTVEDLNGTPSGLTSAVFQLGALQMVGALFAISDKWAFLLAVLTHQAMLRGNLTLGAALREGKRRLATGDWFEDTEDLINKHSKKYIQESIEKNRTTYIEAFQRDFILPMQRDSLKNYYEFWGWTSQAQAKLEKQLAPLTDDDWINTAADGLANNLFASRIPPQPHLGTLLYGVVVFGDIAS